MTLEQAAGVESRKIEERLVEKLLPLAQGEAKLKIEPAVAYCTRALRPGSAPETYAQQALAKAGTSYLQK